MIAEAEARLLIGSEGAQVLVDIVSGAWANHLSEGRKRSSGTRAFVVWDYMVEAADKHFAVLDGVNRVEINRVPVYVVRNRLAIRFKKHDAELHTSNYPTDAQVDLDFQGAFDLMPDVPHVSCGYVLDAAEADVSRIVLVRCVDRRVEWFIDLPGLAAGDLAPTRPILPIGPDSPKLPTISKARKSATDEDD